MCDCVISQSWILKLSNLSAVGDIIFFSTTAFIAFSLPNFPAKLVLETKL